MTATIEPRYAITSPLTTIFTPPASCATHWTYEAPFYNSVPRGVLIQDALDNHPDTDCFPKGWQGFGRAPSATQIFSPGWCPSGYSTAANSYNGAITTAVCCPSSFSYMVTYSSINYYSTSAQFVGCISTYPAASGYTTVLGRANGSDLNTTIVSGPITMWAQPVSVAFQQADIALFTTTSSSSSSTSSTARVTGSPTTSTASQTGTSTSSTGTAGSSAGYTSTENASQGLSGGAIAGIAIGAAAVVGIIIALAIFFVFRRRKNNSQTSASADSAADGGAAAPENAPPQMTEAPSSNQWNGSTYQYYDPVPQEMPTLGYGKSVRRAEKDGNSVPVSHEVAAERDPVELG